MTSRAASCAPSRSTWIRACCPTAFPMPARRRNTTRSTPRSGSSKPFAPILAYTGDLEFVRNELYPVFADIIAWHVRGTRYGIKVDPSGLLTSGEPGVQLTWMDAKVGDWVVTPRRGKPVEIQALWYNALCIMEDLARRFGDEAGQKRYRNMATVAQLEFQSPVLEREDRLSVRRHQWRAAGPVDPPEPDLRGQPAPQHVVARTREAAW